MKLPGALRASNYTVAQQPIVEPTNDFPATVMYGRYYNQDEDVPENGQTASACSVGPLEVV